ncbi:MAG: hypothetical protein PHQ11_05955 [Paludibacter sp.]|nr:hypothetical protein [Paludibacter sp.]MDD4199610.1 hypothetical protein [Paludibacter sp.]MDD4428522.1 hypothetical protein [Paludibacter sp.]
MSKINILYWIIALLLALNISTIGGIIYHHYKEQADETALILDVQNDTKLTGRYFRQVLGFNNKQMDAFRKANRNFQPVANHIIFVIDSLKQEQFTELKKTTADTVKLNQLADSIGMQHAALKKVTNRFYLEIKKVCNDEQYKMLEEVFNPLFKNTIPAGRQHHRSRNSDNK